MAIIVQKEPTVYGTFRLQFKNLDTLSKNSFATKVFTKFMDVLCCWNGADRVTPAVDDAGEEIKGTISEIRWEFSNTLVNPALECAVRYLEKQGFSVEISGL